MSLEEDKEALIEVIEWYRDEYHRSSDPDFHDEVIELVRACEYEDCLEAYRKMVDGWLDR